MPPACRRSTPTSRSKRPSKPGSTATSTGSRTRATAWVGGFWNQLAESLSGETGQPLRAFRIHGLPPLARIAQEAEQAQRAYRPPPAVEEIRDLLGEGVFTVWAEPDADGDMRTAANLQATRIQTIVVRPRGDIAGRNVVQPLSVEVTEGETASNLFGASVELFGAVATFNSTAIRGIIEERDLEVLLITENQEFKCNLDDTRLKRGYSLR